MRHLLIVSWLLLCPLTSAVAQVSIGIGLPNVSIGINLPIYPQLELVPGYPVYYAPSVNGNYFFFDGLYWVYEGDSWYASSWFNGPWALMAPEAVPLFVLRVPVRFYRQPPVYFRGWQQDAPPRWSEHWGDDWGRRHSGWDRWDRKAVPRPAPLPAYQKSYSGDRYPSAEKQPAVHVQSYRYQPRDAVVQQVYQAHGLRAASTSPRGGSQGEAPGKATEQRDARRASPPPSRAAPATPPSRQEPAHAREQQQDRGHPGKRDAKPDAGGNADQSRGEERGRGHDK